MKLNPKVPIDASIEFVWGYLQQEDPEVQLQIIANLLIRFLIERVPQEDHAQALKQIADGIPISRMLNMETQGGVQ